MQERAPVHTGLAYCGEELVCTDLNKDGIRTTPAANIVKSVLSLTSDPVNNRQPISLETPTEYRASDLLCVRLPNSLDANHRLPKL